MPLVMLTYNPHLFSRDTISLLANMLPAPVCSALHIAGNTDWQLAEKEIEVRPEAYSPLAVNAAELSIIVFAHHFPERAANLTERCASVSSAVREYIGPGYDAYVLIRLAPSAYEELYA